MHNYRQFSFKDKEKRGAQREEGRTSEQPQKTFSGDGSIPQMMLKEKSLGGRPTWQALA